MNAAMGIAGIGLVAITLTAIFLLHKNRVMLAEMRARYSPIIDFEARLTEIRAERDELAARIVDRRAGWELEVARTVAEIELIGKQLDTLKDTAELQSFAFYEPHFHFDTSEAFKEAIKANRDRQKEIVRRHQAAVCDIEWTVDGSKAKGGQMTKRQLKLMLRAFNGECDSAVAKARFNNMSQLEERMVRSFDAINSLGESNRCRIVASYRDLKLDELRLTHEYSVKKHDELEEQRRIRAEMQEEERVRREIEVAQREAEKEEARFEQALVQARAELEVARDARHEALQKKIAILEEQVRDAHDRKEKAIARARLTKSGHVYVISNIGSFGEAVFKIGMTRRLEPLDRVRELGDASVPFPFDVHAMIYSEDAPDLEQRLQGQFREQQVNLINPRREFFAVSLEDIRAAVVGLGSEIEFITTAVAEQFRESLAIRKKRKLEMEERKEQILAVEVATARERFERLKETWRAEPV